MYLLVILTFSGLDKTLGKPLIQLKECFRNLCRCLLNPVKAEMASHTAKCLGSVPLFSSELLIEYAYNVYSRFAWKAYNRFALVDNGCNTYGCFIEPQRSIERLVRINVHKFQKSICKTFSFDYTHCLR